MSPSWKLPRRSWLRTLSTAAGAALLTPFVRTLAAEAQGVARKRFLLVHHDNGLFPDRFMPVELRKDGDRFGPDGSTNFKIDPDPLVNVTNWSKLSPSMVGLAKYQKQMVIVDGLTNRQYLDPAAATNVLNHGQWSASFTCMPAIGSGDLRGRRPGGQSFDQYLASSPAFSSGSFRSVDLIADYDGHAYDQLAYGPEKTVPSVRSPRQALLRYFAGVKAVDDGSAKLLIAKKKRLFDVTREDIKRLQTVLAGAERAKLDQYLDSIDRLEKRLGMMPNATCKVGGPALPAGLGESTANKGIPSTDHVEAMMLVATEALACGLTQVASVNCGGYGNWANIITNSPIEGGNDLHNLAHVLTGTGGHLEWDKVYAFISRQIAAAADRLQAVVEGGQSVFKNTTILWQTNNGAHHHQYQQARWNGVIVGDAGGKLRADGRYIKYPTSWVKAPSAAVRMDGEYTDLARSGDQNAHSWADLYCTLAHALGSPTDTFGKGGLEPVKGGLAELLT
jgi:hypothetical protein